MKIGILSPEFPPTVGGVETYAYQYVKTLARLRPEWGIIVLTRPHPEGEIQIPGVSVEPALRRRWRLDRRLIRERQMDVWHVMNAAYGWVAMEARRVVVTVHGNDFLRPYLPLLRPDLQRYLPGRWAPAWLERAEHAYSRSRTLALLERTLPRASCILANSRYTEEAFLRRFPNCAGRTVRAMVGVGEEFFTSGRGERAPGEPLRLVTVSRLSEPRKNLDLVLRALARLAGEHDFVYRIVGEGWDRPRLEALAQTLGIAGRVAFLGRLPQAEMIRVLGTSDLFILASSVLRDSHEGFGIVYLEANACGTPVLAARLGGAVEAVAEGESGMLIDDANVEAIEAALASFLRGEVRFSPGRCRGHAGRFTWDAVVKRALPCYLAGPV